ncbi:hypothetical protein LX36DRAFT_713296 [Colletotrichum falcatum]|nr:hypothetical protein LX36DRAFT_713296 [Colletotrichum falcatum]
MSPRVTRAPRCIKKNHPEYLAHRVWVPLVPPQEIQSELGYLQDIHNTFLDVFDNGRLKLPGLVSPSPYSLDSDVANDLSTLQASVRPQQTKRTPIDFVAANNQIKASADGATATIHLLTTQGDTSDLTWLYEEAYRALQPGGWLMQLHLHHQPEAHLAQAQRLAIVSHTQPPADPVKTALQNGGFINLSLSVASVPSSPGSVGGKGNALAATGTCEMRVWVAQKPRIYRV